jgi:hypothetical protein
MEFLNLRPSNTSNDRDTTCVAALDPLDRLGLGFAVPVLAPLQLGMLALLHYIYSRVYAFLPKREAEPEPDLATLRAQEQARGWRRLLPWVFLAELRRRKAIERLEALERAYHEERERRRPQRQAIKRQMSWRGELDRVPVRERTAAAAAAPLVCAGP